MPTGDEQTIAGLPRLLSGGKSIARAQAWKRLEILSAATGLDDLRALPSNRLEALHSDRSGQYSIRINKQWRICFEWPQGAKGPSNVEIVDYH